MSIQADQEKLFGDFAYPSYGDWKAAVEKSLKGASFDKLLTDTYEGITLQPIYRPEDIEHLDYILSQPGQAPYVRGTKAAGDWSWDISQEIQAIMPQALGEVLRSDLARGQTGIHLSLDRASLRGLDPDEVHEAEIGEKGVSLVHLQDLENAFASIDVEKTPLFLRVGSLGLPYLALLLAWANKHQVDLSQLKGCIGMDPIGFYIKEGELPFPLEKAYDHLVEVTRASLKQAPNMRTVLVEGHPYHDGGANAVQELAFVLATGVHYIRQLMERGLSIDEIDPRIVFSFSIGSHFFMEIAKLRAARVLWCQIIKAFGGNVESQKMYIHGRTSAFNKTVYDPYMNMLRVTSEAFAAVVGGVDSLHVSPFDEGIRFPSEFSRRIARNTQLILQHEAHLSRVADPAGGSWYVEWLTDQVAQKAWSLFQQVESRGGIVNSLTEGWVQEQVAVIAQKRIDWIGKRQDRIVGTNMYPNLSEKTLENDEVIVKKQQQKRLAEIRSLRSDIILSEHSLEASVQAFQSGLTVGQWVKSIATPVSSIRPIPAFRAAEHFELLRKNAESYREKYGAYPRIFLAKIGSAVRLKPRADFTVGFFQVGGFDVIQQEGFSSVEEVVDSYCASPADILVICSQDDQYPEIVSGIVRKVKERRPESTVFLAGLPAKELQECFLEAGLDDFVHVQADCFNVLSNLQQKKGIAK
jgi:methylmalonyl-CoA mutase